ncbi:ABC transporter ATP-binding protein [Halioglobus japonicus]|uniref:ABC transporter ATP-binding protein n=1 Tax=Halioglobus japonicus TaxID=930805 RepID=A0AAP8MBL8_9GAMM|nr:ABC transporter ATP-binding protein [Halioglobus japonicus]PLW84785.1 ABC transporter ATP-binding protein [Halioglobus japonicus]
MQIVRKLLFLLQPRERIQLYLLMAAVIFSAMFEMIGIASISPFLTTATNPEAVYANEWLSFAYRYSGAESPEEFLIYLGVFSSTFICISNAFIAFTLWAQLRIAGNFRYSISTRLMAHYAEQDYTFFLDNNTAELHKNLISEIDFVSSSILRPVLRFIARLIASIAIILLIVFMDPILAAIVGFGFGLAYVLVFLFVRRKISRQGELRASSNTDRAKSANELLAGIKTIKMLGKETYFLRKFAIAVKDNTRTTAMNGFLGELPRYLLEAITLVSVILVATIFLGTDENFIQKIPMMGVYIYAGYRLLPNLQQVYASYVQLGFGHAGLDNLYLAMREVTEINSEPDPKVEKRFRLSDCIELRDTTFTYPGADRPSLDSLNCKILAHRTYGVVGKTGAGKSTFIDLLLGLLPGYRGAILVDGCRLSERNLGGWRKTIGYVPQSIYLSDTTISENIAFGVHKDCMDEERIRRAAKIAQADEFIHLLPNGFKTVVGERGVRLSGGQVQRIGIARALYSSPEILIFDEATSALDKDTEAALVESLKKLHGNKTIIIVAHRLETLKYCDSIIRLENGSIAEIENLS